nr:RNA-directed DNA polymerase, eukaryota [Tanacetum cinerariifolium]
MTEPIMIEVSTTASHMMGLDLPEILVEVERHGSSFAELLIIPEEVDWIYVDGKSTLCVAFILEMYKEARLFGGFFKGCNSSFVTLIPKIIDAKFVNDFRPISLIGSVYKVVTKVLANRLVSVIRDLVSDTQSAFVAGRQILDGPFILDEILK